jgi:hypothetical protein
MGGHVGVDIGIGVALLPSIFWARRAMILESRIKQTVISTALNRAIATPAGSDAERALSGLWGSLPGIGIGTLGGATLRQMSDDLRLGEARTRD